MWSPEGYINWGEFNWLCWRAAKLRWPTPFGYIRPTLKNGSRDWENDNRFKAETTYQWLIYCALHGRHPVTSICSPSGQVLTASGWFFCTKRHGSDLADPASFALLSDIPNEHFSFAKFVGGNGLKYVDINSGQILRPHLRDLCALNCIQFLQWIRLKKDRTAESQLRNWHFARRFAGWAVCFEKNELFSSGEAFLLGFTAIMSVPDDPPPNTDSVVASGLEYTYECFNRAFPDGKGSATWPEVEAKTGYSRRNINRALAAFSGQTAGQDSGQSSI